MMKMRLRPLKVLTGGFLAPVYDMFEIVPVAETIEVRGKAIDEPLHQATGIPGSMGGQLNLRMRIEWMACRQWLGLRHVQRCPSDTPFVKRRDEGRIVYQQSTRDID